MAFRRSAVDPRTLLAVVALAAAVSACGGPEGAGAPAQNPAPASTPTPPPAPPPGSVLAAPIIAGISPVSGPAAGVTTVTITGSDFVSGATVSIGGTNAAVSAVTATTITAATNGGPVGPADVVVRNPDGQTATSAAAFTYVAAPPVVAAINVHGSPQAGGGLLLFAGSGLENTTSVSFGGSFATGRTYDPLQRTLLVVVPPSPAGPTADVFVAITLVNADGQSTSWPSFHYGNAPVVASFTPEVGAKADTVTITGTDFTADTTGVRAGLQVSFGGTPAVIESKSPTQVTVTVPKLNPGIYQLVVVNFDGQYDVATGSFTVPGP